MGRRRDGRTYHHLAHLDLELSSPLDTYDDHFSSRILVLLFIGIYIPYSSGVLGSEPLLSGFIILFPLRASGDDSGNICEVFVLKWSIVWLYPPKQIHTVDT